MPTAIAMVSDTCIIAWHSFRHYAGTGTYTFEVILTADGNMLFQYQNVSGTLDSHTIGIENASGITGLEYVHNAYLNESGTAIYFGRRPPRYATHDVLPTVFLAPSASGPAGSPIAPSVRYFNSGVFIESFDARVSIDRGGEVYNQTIRINSLRPESTATAVFPIFTPNDPGYYSLRSRSVLPTDLYPLNDTIDLTYFAYTNYMSSDFEEDGGAFAGDHDWQWGQPTRGPQSAHSGTKVWGTILDGDYSLGPILSTLFADTLLLDTSAVLTFWHWYDIEALFDGGNVKLSTDDGITWDILLPEDGYDGVISNVFHNPLGGQQAFYGTSNAWIQERFDLSDYGGENVLIKFDFGSDNSTIGYGWYIDDYAVQGARQAPTGWLSGVVTDETTQNPVSGAQVRAGLRSDESDSLGRYVIELLPGSYTVSAEAEYYNPFSIENVIIIPGDTNSLGLALASPAIAIDTSAIDTTIAPEQSTVVTRQLSNPGGGPLEFRLRIESGGRQMPLEFGDELFIFDPQTPTSDESCVGVEFDGHNFWVTGRHESDDVHKLYKFGRDGALLASYDQGTTSLWGWRDLAWDGDYLYASDENELAVIDPATGQKVDTLPMPTSIPRPLRALAYDPASDHFWAANFSSNIIEFNRAGQVVSTYLNDRHIYGLAWDNASPGGPFLWVFSQDGTPLTQVSQFSPASGAYTGVGFQAVDHNGGLPDLASGACFTTEWDPAMGVMFCLVLGRTTLFDSIDRVQGYEITTISRWLTAEPVEGVIPAGGSVPVVFTMTLPDSLSAPDTTFEAVVVIENNSRITPTIPVRAGIYSGIDDGGEGLPAEFELSQNYPNPFNGSTLISFALPSASDISLDIFNIMGQRVASLAMGPMIAGRHAIRWDADGLASGLYFVRLAAGNLSQVRITTLLK